MVFAGPPYITDDPEPVEYRHWEVYLASIFTEQPDAWIATAPHLEVNYGAVPNLQLHTILPMTLYAPAQGASSYGYSDTELGAKYRFVQEGKWVPQIGTFLLLEVPTGSHARNLGSGHLQTFLPLWIQKSFGPWTAYGGGGYWVNPGAHNQNWWFIGLVVQCEVARGLNSDRCRSERRPTTCFRSVKRSFLEFSRAFPNFSPSQVSATASFCLPSWSGRLIRKQIIS